MKVVVVESPAKAKTINKYLGPGYEVIASFGHIRDLPPKDGSVEPDADFAMIWEVDGKSGKHVSEIARAVKGAERLILATDPDREGEAISWHVREVLEQKRVLKGVHVERVTFNAITKDAVQEAMARPREIDRSLVEAYLARRALDYLVGFRLSPVLWRKLPGARSAGRVQSVALRLVCDREREIEAFVPREYWSITALLATAAGAPFEARLVGADGRKISRLDVGKGAEAEAFRRDLDAATFTVGSVEAKPGEATPRAALHDLVAPAGSEPQARDGAGARDAGRAAALRGRRDRRRDDRPHHLYADRRRRHGTRGDRRGAARDRQGIRRPLRSGGRRAATASRRRTRRRRTRRSARPASRAIPRRSAISTPTSSGSTS